MRALHDIHALQQTCHGTGLHIKLSRILVTIVGYQAHYRFSIGIIARAAYTPVEWCG